jgi:lambda family phage tail tape measure protein
MAKQIEDIVVRLGLEKFEGLDKIRSSFRDLSKVTNLSERDINAARTSLFEFAKAAGNTEAVNKGLASALQGLRTQVDTCGRAYAQLTKDLNRLNEVSRGSTDALERQRQALLNNANAGRQNVDSLQRQIDALKQLQRETRPGSSAFIQLGKDIDNVTVKLGKLKSEAQGFNLALNQQAGATPSVLNNQIAILQRGLQTVRYDAEKFVDTLRQIQLLQITQSGRTGRSGVIAAYEAFQSPAYMGGFADPSRLSAMPDTTAALNQELAELSERLLNTARGSSTYTDVAIRMAEVQRQLRTDVMGTSEAFRQLSIAEAGAERRAGKLADIQSYYATQGPLAPGVGGYRDPNTGAMIAAGAYTPGRIRVDEAAYARPIGPQPFPEAATQALQSVESAQRSVTDIYERAFIQRTELQAKYNQIYIDKALEGLELEGQLRKKEFDTQLADFDRRMGIADKRRGRRLSGMQLAQGVGAALSGGIFGGPEGLIGGLGGLALGGVGGAFAGAAAGAQVGMFRQQLGTVTDYSARIDKLQIALRGIVGSQDAYSQALSAAASVTRDLNIPQEVAIQGMTRLSAAVKGAGGTVSDSAFAFRAVSEAVKATGGNAEQADGALLALTQVFSKGKVSAEELNQIAERLPGTFTLFAKAAGMTGPQLQKALQEGQVGLNDLMKFLQLISTEYGQTALKIAKSSQEAGARLTVAMQNMQLEVGRALQPLGADLQNAFAVFITDITPAVVAAAQGFVGVAKAIGAAGDAFMDFTAPVRDFFATGMPAYLQVAKAFWDSIANDVSAFWTRIGSFFTGLQTISSTALKAIGIDVGGLGDTMQIVATNVGKFWSSVFDFIKGRWRETVSNMINYSNPLLAGLKLFGIADVGKAVTKGIAAGATAMSPIFKLPQAQQSTAESPSVFPSPAADKEKEKKAAKDKADRERQAAAAEQQRLANTLLDQQLRAADRVFQHQIELDRQRYELQKRLDDAQAQNRIMRETGAARDIVSNFEDLQRSLREIEERRVRAAQDVRLAKQTQQSAAVRATFDAQGAAMLRGTTGVIARTGSTGQSTGPHLDARWADGRRITAADADRYLSVNGRTPSSYGVTSPYGPRSLFGRTFHAGIDFGTPSGSGITLKNGATLLRDLGFTGAGGYAVEINTKDGPMRLLHLQRGSARMPAGAATQQNRAIKSSGGAVIEGLDVTQAEAQQQLIEANVSKERAALFEQFTLRATDALKQQNKELSDSNALQTLRNRLTLEGVSPALIELEERLLGNRQKQNEAQAKYNTLIANEKDPATRAELTNSLAQLNEFYAEQARLLRDAAAAKETFDKAMRTRQDERIGLGLREGAEAYVQSIGTMREATAQLAQTGIKGVEDAIFSLTTTGKANFQEFAKSVLESTSRMIIQQLILRSVMQIIGAIGGGSSGGFSFSGAGPVSGASVFGSTQAGFNPLAFSGIKLNALGNAYAANGIVPFAMGGAFQHDVTAYAMGGVVDQPTMFKFADGGAGRLGLMGEAGPEAIMPLRRLPNGRLGVEQAGGGAPVTVNVSVDASGTSVQGNAGQGEQLGRVISQAVQAELVRQQRPGGLLSR